MKKTVTDLTHVGVLHMYGQKHLLAEAKVVYEGA